MTLIATIVICVIIAGLGIRFQLKYSARAVTQGPALLTMLGIAGTFLGIAVGLYNFNTSDVQGSIPGLIEGIRASVWASFTGIFFAILIKLRYAFAPEESATTGDKSDVEILVEHLEAIRKTISAENDLTVTSEIKLVRSEIAYKLDALQRSVAELAEREASSRTP